LVWNILGTADTNTGGILSLGPPVGMPTCAQLPINNEIIKKTVTDLIKLKNPLLAIDHLY